MSGQLLSSAELAPSVPEGTSPQQCIAIWLDLLHTGHKLLLAGLRRDVGPDGDVHKAYCQWYARQMEEHDQTVVRMLQRMNDERNAS